MKIDWQTKKIEEVLDKVNYTNKILSKNYHDMGKFPIVSQEEKKISGYWNNPADVFNIESPVVVFGDHTKIIKYIDFDFVLGADGLKVLQPKQCLNAKYLFYFLNSIQIKSLGYARHYKLLKDFLISFPISLSEQARIVKKIDEIFEKIDKAKENTEKNLQNSCELFESYLQSIFLNSGKKWEEKSFEEVCELIGGSQPSKDNFIYESKDGYVRLIQVRDYRTDKFATYIPKNKAKRFCSEDDIMIGRYGPPIFGVFKGLKGAYNVALMKAVVDEKICHPDYFYWFLKTNKLRDFVEKSSKRAAGQDGVRKELLDKYPVPVPNLSEQIKLVHKLSIIKLKIDNLGKNYERKLVDLGDLKKTVLQKAFAGEL
ncbi:MAG TPA: restriction endonuclease subunit S [Patescibacteria group bacterium]|nr:restriction endonuclease subunit S [Patescibacteria group bacterium]